MDYHAWFPSSIRRTLSEKLVKDAHQELWHECKKLIVGCNVKREQLACDIVAREAFPNQTELFLLTILVAETKGEVNSTDEWFQHRTLIQLMMANSCHPDIIHLRVVYGAVAAKSDRSGRNAFH